MRNEQLREVEKEALAYEVHRELSNNYRSRKENEEQWKERVAEELRAFSLISSGDYSYSTKNDELLWVKLLFITLPEKYRPASDEQKAIIAFIKNPGSSGWSAKELNEKILSKVYGEIQDKDARLSKAKAELKDLFPCWIEEGDSDLWLKIAILKHPKLLRFKDKNLLSSYGQYIKDKSSRDRGASHVILNEITCKAVFPKEYLSAEKEIPPGLRAYRLAVTDLFVEKALGYLEKHAGPFAFWGKILHGIAIVIVLLGAVCAFMQMFGISPGDIISCPDSSKGSQALKPPLADISYLYALSSPDKAEIYRHHIDKNNRTDLQKLTENSTLTFEQKAVISGQARFWEYGIIAFTRAFTAYGMLVLIAVALWRFGKAMLDQSERLMERRHALRQGRLFVHLNDGQLTIDEMEKAFNWNVTQSNAFADLPTDAQAPWGTVAKETLRATPEIIKAVGSIAEKKEKSKR